MIFDIMVDSVRYAFSKPKNLLILFILNLFDFLIIPIIFSIGYYYKITKESTRGMINAGEEMPIFKNYKQLFTDGIKVIAVSAIYMAIPLILFLVLNDFSKSGHFPYYLIDPVSNSVFFIFYCYFYIALPNMAYHDSFKKAFDFKQINNIILNKIGVIPIILLLLVLDFVEYVFEGMGVDTIDVLHTFLNLNTVSTHVLAFIIMTLISIFIGPIVDIIIARSTALLYVND